MPKEKRVTGRGNDEMEKKERKKEKKDCAAMRFLSLWQEFSRGRRKGKIKRNIGDALNTPGR